MLQHFLRAAPKYIATLNYQTNVNDTSAQTTYSYTLSGTFSPGLYVIGTVGEGTGTTMVVSSATFDSNSMQLAVKTNSVGTAPSSTAAGIFYYRQASSITNPVVTVTYSVSCARSNIGVWRIDNVTTDTPFFTTSDASTVAVTSLSNTVTNLNTNYGVISIMAGSGNATLSWTNSNKRYEASLGTSTDGTGADYTATSYEASRTITANSTLAMWFAVVSAVWR